MTGDFFSQQQSDMSTEIRGYLNEPFRVFYNTGVPKEEVLPHYHDFRKIVILLSGNIGYMIEEQQYDLKPGSIVFVDAGKIHRPLLHKNDEYERIIVYLSDEYLRSQPGLMTGFELTMQRGIYVIESPEMQNLIGSRARELTDKKCEKSLSAKALQEMRLSEFLIMCGDVAAGSDEKASAMVTANKSVLQAIDYISEDISRDLSVDAIADHVHLNRSYLMHLFKNETGYTVKEFVTDKRLFFARAYIEKGVSMAEVAERCGFESYSSFYRCYQAKYGVSPKATTRSKLFTAVAVE